jgi:ADP-ribose pyrophosphatase YjhB (NUDIX family)
MAKILEGPRIGKTATLKVGCCAAIFDESGQKLLLTRRSDNGQWCLPGGGMDAGESASEACIREVREETGLRVSISRLVGTYTSPDRKTVYADGNEFQFVSILL